MHLTIFKLLIHCRLQCDISKRFNLKKKHYYSHSHLLNISMFLSFENRKKVEDCINILKVTPTEQRLLAFDDCLNFLTSTQMTPTHKKSVMTTDTTEEKKLFIEFHLIGQNLLNMNKFIDAKEYLEKALLIQETKFSGVATDKDVAIIFKQIGQCLIKMNELTDGKEYLEKALTNQQTISRDVATEKDVASTSYEIGRGLIEMNKLTDANDHLQKALFIQHKISSDIALIKR